ncbi:MAG: HAD family hydrolase [Kiritimatiellae bacterium]|nr:HAD family hydrolase [Kiritimatiellia bacterium]
MLKKKPKHIIWDWNGTLQNDVTAAVVGINYLLEQRGMPLVDIEKHRELFSFPARNYYIALGFDLEKENWDEMSNTFIKAFLAEPSTDLFDWTIPTLSFFKKQGIGMSVVSAAEQNTLKKTVEQYGILHYFDNIVGLTDHGAGSKAENAYRLIKRLDLPPNEIILVGDTSHDKEVADFVGCNCILVECGYESRERLLKTGATVLPSIKELTNLFE